MRVGVGFCFFYSGIFGFGSRVVVGYKFVIRGECLYVLVCCGYRRVFLGFGFVVVVGLVGLYLFCLIYIDLVMVGFNFVDVGRG